MNRSKFRGKRIDNGEWAYGNLITPTFDNSNNIFGHFIYELNKTNYFSTGGSKLEDFYEMPLVGVVPNTVGQYTGLQDSTKWGDLSEKEQREWLNTGKTLEEWNGKEIYEGDIIKITFNTNFAEKPFYFGKVVYGSENGYPAFDLDPWIDCEMNALSWLKSESDESVISYEVIGKICESPEILLIG